MKIVLRFHFITRVHQSLLIYNTYLHNHYKFPVRIKTYLLTPPMLSVLILYMSGGITRFEGRFRTLDFLRNFSWQFFICFQIFFKICLRNARSAKYLFLENALKKLLNIFSNFFFRLKPQSFRLIMQNNSNGCLGWPCSSLHDQSNF